MSRAAPELAAPLKRETMAAVLEKLEVDRPAPDLAGLRALYAAWCGAVPFDNVLKLIHLARGCLGPLPGSTTEGFFAAWLELGTGGTCWAGNGALHDLLHALGFDVTRAIATMLSSSDARAGNHGTVIATIDDERWMVDASILSREPIRIPAADRADAPLSSGSLPRFAWLDGAPAVLWRTPRAPDAMPCRIERMGGGAAEWDASHQRTRTWGPFNYQLNVRVQRDDASLGIFAGSRFAIGPDGSLSLCELDRDQRVRLLVEEIGISERIAVRIPDDRPTPPRPEGH
jgi:N-hydroxyarylamine O-acetyltransferase